MVPVQRHFLVASDFDQTLSFNDSGVVLSQLIGASGFEDKVAGLARSNLVHQGGELAYLLRHDPEFSRRKRLARAASRSRAIPFPHRESISPRIPILVALGSPFRERNATNRRPG